MDCFKSIKASYHSQNNLKLINKVTIQKSSNIIFIEFNASFEIFLNY